MAFGDLGELFGRVVRVEVGQPGAVGIAYEGLRVVFAVERTAGRALNSAKVQIYGLSATSSARFSEKDAELRLLAGYGVPGQIFIGGIDRAVRKQQGADWITEIEAQDGASTYRGVWISKTWAAQTTTDQILAEIARMAGLPLGYVAPLPNVTISTPLTVSGPLRSALSALADTVGAEWSIQDGELQVLVPTGGTSSSAVRLSPESGLIDSPQKTKEGVEVVALLQPTITPGRRFVLDSREFKGIYRAKEVRHEGDSGWGQPFYTHIVGTPVEA